MTSACVAGDEMLEVDIIKAFPSGDMDNSLFLVYIQQPPDFEVKGMAASLLLKPHTQGHQGDQAGGRAVSLWMTGNAKTTSRASASSAALSSPTSGVWRKVTDQGTLRLAIYVELTTSTAGSPSFGCRALLDKHFVIPLRKSQQHHHSR